MIAVDRVFVCYLVDDSKETYDIRSVCTSEHKAKQWCKMMGEESYPEYKEFKIE
jgi:predicted transcriptional regulator